MATRYTPHRPGRSRFVTLRGLKHHLNVWGDATLVTPERPPLLLMHGWMDVGASFQFIVDALAAAALHHRRRLARLRPERPDAVATATGSPTTWATWTR